MSKQTKLSSLIREKKSSQQQFKQLETQLEIVNVKNIILDPHYQYNGPKLKNSIRIPNKNIKPLKTKFRKQLQTVLPEVNSQQTQYPRNKNEKIPSISTDKSSIKEEKDSLNIFSSSNKKKTLLLNSIIQILQNKESQTNDLKPQKQRNQKNIKTQPSHYNEFAELRPMSFKNNRGPRLIQNNINKLTNNQAIPRRKMFSQEKNRRRESDPSQKKIDSVVKPLFDPKLMTFYNNVGEQGKVIKKYEEDNQFLYLKKQ